MMPALARRVHRPPRFATCGEERAVNRGSMDIERQRQLAYRLWEERGRPIGRADEDWFEAERRLRSNAHDAESQAIDEAVRESFPASDPPSTSIPGKRTTTPGTRRRR